MSSGDFKVRSMFREYDVSFVEPPVLRELAPGQVAIVDRALLDLHAATLGPVLDPDRTIVLDATEESKTIAGCTKVIEDLVARQFRRDGTIVAIGGGIIQDIAAFSASILYRGVQWMFVPTTLLAQADSCIGSKTSINLGDKKNLVGNFYPPSRILIDPAFLDTLSVADVKSGIGEMLHFYFYADSPLVATLMDEYDALLVDRRRLRPFISESLRIKRSVAEVDEFDKGERNKFNYGHTFGHALESATHYEIRHGLAVTVGMDLANYISVRLGKMPVGTFNAMHAVLKRNLPDRDLASIDLDAYVSALTRDKKNVGADLVCILASRPGALERVKLPFDERLRSTIAAYYRERVWAMDALTAEAAT